MGKARTTHGKSRTAEHWTYRSMISRCYYPTEPSYRNYGARGITVCDRWRGPGGFANWLADFGPRPSPQHTRDRIDNDGPYSPENCQWALPKEQLSNRRTNRKVEFRGEEKTLTQWAELLGINASTLFHRWARGERGDHLMRPTESQGRKRHPATSSK